MKKVNFNNLKHLVLTIAFLTILALTMSATSQAATYVVTRTDDRNATCASGADCSLREAVKAANATTADDTINFAIPAASCAGGVCTITLTGELTILETATGGALTITNTTGQANLRVSGNNATRIFYMNVDSNLTLNGLTVTAGNGTGQNSGIGGAIVSAGILTLNNSIVSNSIVTAANGAGGGILNFGTLNVTNSTISGNTAPSGGGITSNGTALTITNSTISGNTANVIRGGGVENFSGTLTATDSTFSGNMAINGAGGGGIYAIDTTILTRVTISGNTASSGGGIFNNVANTLTMTNSTVSGNTAYGTNAAGNSGGVGGIESVNADFTLNSVTVTGNSSTAADCTNCAGGIRDITRLGTLQNTIVAGNTVANAASSPDYRGQIAPTSSFNLVGNGDGITNGGITNGTNGNQVGTTANPINPQLAPLASNGGATQTHALLSNSPAIDQGNSFGLTTDQRGSTRPINNPSVTNAAGGDAADIGAFETQVPTTASVTISGRVLTTEGRGLINARVTLTDQNGSTRTALTSTFGYYRFDEIEAGQTYVLQIVSKRYSFAAQIVSVAEEIEDLNFTGAPQTKRLRE